MEVIVLAGGLGTRLQPVLAEIPKCLAPIGLPEVQYPSGASAVFFAPEEYGLSGGGRPFMGYLLEWLVEQGVTHVVFSVGYLKEQVMAYVQGQVWPFSYDFAVEETPLGTGGGIRLALGKCHENEVFVVNGDTFFPVALKTLTTNAPITVALKPMRNFSRYGAVETTPAGPAASGKGPEVCSAAASAICFVEAEHTSGPKKLLQVTAFHEKAPCEEGLINGGVYAINRSLLDLQGLPERFSFEKDVLEPGASRGQVWGRISDAYFIDIGIPEDYATAQWAIPAWFAVQKASEAVLAADADTLFLDRDGVLNRHLEGDYVKSWEEWEWMPGMLDALAQWARKFTNIVLVTNQRGVGKGVMSDADLAEVHKQMLREIRAAGGRIDLVLVCTATDDADPRRKPNTGMFQEACALLPDIDPARSVMVGDSPKDALFAARSGIGFIPLLPEGAS